MNITVIHGQSHKGITYTMTQRIIDSMMSDELRYGNFFLPNDGPGFCIGCNSCFLKGENSCPGSDKVQPVAKAMDWADIILLDSPNYVMEMSGSLKKSNGPSGLPLDHPPAVRRHVSKGRHYSLLLCRCALRTYYALYGKTAQMDVCAHGLYLPARLQCHEARRTQAEKGCRAEPKGGKNRPKGPQACSPALRRYSQQNYVFYISRYAVISESRVEFR